METRSRAILKALSWRVTATSITFLIAWFLSGDFSIGFQIGVADFVIKLLTYYFHERLWNKIRLGYVPYKIRNVGGDGI